MARNSKARPTNRQEQKPKEARGGLSSIAVAIIAAAGTVGGVFIQGYFDVLGTNQALVIQYSQAANESSDSVEQIISKLVSELGDPNARITSEQAHALKDALLKLRRDAELLTIQVGAASTPFNYYEKSMADLSEAAQNITGPADSKIFIRALSSFYLAKKRFEEQIAIEYNSASA